MGSFRVLSQRTGRMATLAALVVATLGQALLPALASADGVTSRSIELSSASADAAGVTYKVSFTAATGVGAYVVEFCKNSPVIGQACTAPGGFDATSAALGADGTTATAVTGSTNKLVVTNTIAAAGAVTDTFTGIHNPTASTDPLYARIMTYDTATDATNATGDLGTGSKDSGTVTIAIVNNVNVSGLVQESMTFCTSGATITNCGTTTPPSLKLGATSGSVTALDATNVYDGTIYTQLSTNAASGAVVSLKSSAANCGGLLRAGAPTACDIKPATTANGNVTAGKALFGVKLGANVDDTANNNGVLQAVGSYNSSTYFMGFDEAHPTAPTSGVTSTYGDPILNTNSLPANGLNMPLTFGASIANNTPAGNYSADLSLIATGTF